MDRKLTLSLVLLLLVAPLVSASCGYSYYPSYSSYSAGYSYYPYKTTYLVPPAVVVQPVLAYGFQYVGPKAVESTTTTTTTVSAASATITARATREDQFRATVVGELRSMRSRLERIERGTAPPPPPAGAGKGLPAPKSSKAPTADEGLVVFQNKCGVCHREGVSERENPKGIVYFDRDGKYQDQTPTVMLKTIQVIDRGEMPPEKNAKGIAPLTDEEATAITTFLHSRPMGKDAPRAKDRDEQIPSGVEFVSIRRRQISRPQSSQPTIRTRRIKR